MEFGVSSCEQHCFIPESGYLATSDKAVRKMQRSLQLYLHQVRKTILCHQNPVTGLIPSGNTEGHAWVRDNTYAIHCCWGLWLAYKKLADIDEDLTTARELEKTVVKCMRSLLMCMMQQADKVERFKKVQSPENALHAKYHSATLRTVVGDFDWGHLQIDAVAFYLLSLAQMTASGILSHYLLIFFISI